MVIEREMEMRKAKMQRDVDCNITFLDKLSNFA